MDGKKLKILRSVLGGCRKVGEEFLFFCPFCKHHKAKLSVNLRKGAKCWVCGWASPKLYRLIRRLGTRQQRDEWRELEGTVEISEFSIDIFKEKEQEIEQVLSLPDSFVSLANKSTPRSAMFAKKYLRDRGVTKADILYWKIGYCTEGEYKNRIVIPSFNNEGYVNYFIARTYTNDWPKYKNPPVNRNIVFNELYVDWDEEVILVEGTFDAIVAGQNSVPMLGSNLRERSKLFQKVAMYDTPVYLAFDKDAEKKETEIARRFLEYDVELYKIDITGYNDVGEMRREEFVQRKKEARLINIDTFLFNQAMAI